MGCSQSVQKKQKKQIISAKLKRDVWILHVNLDWVYCPACPIYSKHKPNILYIDQYSCGHVIAESKGGLTNIENLRPICVHCNSKMQTKTIKLPLVYSQKIEKHQKKNNE